MVTNRDTIIEWTGNKIEESVAMNMCMVGGIRMGVGMKALDRILELLEESEWHSLEDIKAQVHLPDENFAPILSFLADFGFIELKGGRSVAKINPIGLTLLELPVEEI